MKKFDERLLDYKEKYQVALMAYDNERSNFDLWQSQYDGTMQPRAGRKTKTIFNFTKELIESQIDNSLPPPKVEADKPTERNKELALVVEQMLRGEMKRLGWKEENDQDERTAKIHGGDLRLIEWDNTIKTHSTVGAANSLLIHPLQYIPQEGVYLTKQMDYQFVTFEKTKARIKEQYGKDVDDESVDQQTGEPTMSNDTVTQVICYYRNKKGGIGVYSWCGDTVLIDDDEYNARGKMVCVKCGLTKQGKECACGSRKFEKRNLEYEELDEDIIRKDGVVIPAMSIALDEDGNPALREIEEQVYDVDEWGQIVPLMKQVFDNKMNVIGEEPMTETVERTYEEPTKIPYYMPKNFPLAIRKNVSKHNSVLGDSDCEAIRLPQDEANKISTKFIKKALNAGSYLAKPRELNFNFGNSDIGDENNQTIDLTDPSQMSMIRAINLNFDVSQEIAIINQLYMWAKSILGINESSQGKADPTAPSGRAKEIQVARAMGRQESKVEMKNAFYTQCYRIIFEYMLAYADEPREYAYANDEGEDEIVVFNRYDFLEQDPYGNWYYNDEFTFSVDAQGNAQESRQFVLETMTKDFHEGLYGDPTDPETMLNMWKDRESMNYPNAKRQVSRWQKKLEEISEQQEMMQGMQGLPQLPQLQGGMEDVMPQM